MIYTAKIEQTFAYPKRMKYIPNTDSFIEKNCDSLSYVRNVRQPYGWLVESGTPPCDHLDVILMTDKEYCLGDTEQVRIIGVFCRNDGDHKLVVCRLIGTSRISLSSPTAKKRICIAFTRERIRARAGSAETGRNR